MKKILIFMFSICSFFGCKSQSSETISIIDVATFKKALSTNSDIQLIDVRTPKEYKAGHIENARLIDYFSTDFNSKIQELDREKPVYLYCKSGTRSGKSSKILDSLGFTEIVDLKGGFVAWSNQ